MARVRVGHAGTDADAPRARGAQRETLVDLPKEALVGEPEVVVTELLGLRSQLRQSLGRQGRQDQKSGAQRAAPRRGCRGKWPRAVRDSAMRAPRTSARRGRRGPARSSPP